MNHQKGTHAGPTDELETLEFPGPPITKVRRGGPQDVFYLARSLKSRVVAKMRADPDAGSHWFYMHS